MTAAAMADDVRKMCDTVEKKLLQQVATRSRDVSFPRSYSKQDFLAALEVGEDAWTAMKNAGLKSKRSATRSLSRGRPSPGGSKTHLLDPPRAQWMIDADVDERIIQRIMRHESVETLRRFYARGRVSATLRSWRRRCDDYFLSVRSTRSGKMYLATITKMPRTFTVVVPSSAMTTASESLNSFQ